VREAVHLWKGRELLTPVDTQLFKRGEELKAFGRNAFQIREAFNGEAR
jgi:hypothetical protein